MTVAAILAGDPKAVTALAEGKVPAWQPLLEMLAVEKPAVAPRAFIEAIFAIDPKYDAWTKRAVQSLASFESEHFSTIDSGMRCFYPWLDAGVEAALGPSSSQARRVRFRACRSGAGDDLFELTRAYLEGLPADESPKHRLECHHLLARRAIEEGRFTEALGACTSAPELNGSDLTMIGTTRRFIGAALLSLERFDEAFVVLDEAMRTRGPLLGGGGSHRELGVRGARARAVNELQMIAQWSMHGTAEWVRALGGVVEVYSNASLGPTTHRESLLAHFVIELDDLLAGDEAIDEVETVIRQAEERNFSWVVSFIRIRAKERGIEV